MFLLAQSDWIVSLEMNWITCNGFSRTAWSLRSLHCQINLNGIWRILLALAVNVCQTEETTAVLLSSMQFNLIWFKSDCGGLMSFFRLNMAAPHTVSKHLFIPLHLTLLKKQDQYWHLEPWQIVPHVRCQMLWPPFLGSMFFLRVFTYNLARKCLPFVIEKCDIVEKHNIIFGTYLETPHGNKLFYGFPCWTVSNEQHSFFLPVVHQKLLQWDADRKLQLDSRWEAPHHPVLHHRVHLRYRWDDGGPAGGQTRNQIWKVSVCGLFVGCNTY